MERYFAQDSLPLVQTYRDYTVYGSVPATSGGASLISKLNILENRKPSRDVDPALDFHYLIEAYKKQPSLRDKLADPNLWPVDLNDALSKTEGLRRFQTIDADRASTPREVRALNEDIGSPETPGGTTAFVVADHEGNMVSVTQTLGTWGGSFHVTPGLGFLYNDKFGSYSMTPGNYNALTPFARNRTSISPALVFKGTGANARPWLAVGAAGNAWITSAVYNIIVQLIDFGSGLQQAVESPRFLLSTATAPGDEGREASYTVQIENGIAPSLLDQLRARGHRFQLITRPGEIRQGYASAVLVEGGSVRAAADPRRSGQADGLPKYQ